MAIVNTSVISVEDLLRTENLKIPDFQRPYKWTVKNVSQLLDDIRQFSTRPSYRLGTVVIYKEGAKLYIVDGQQRAVTFLLIFKAIVACKYAKIENNRVRYRIDATIKTCFNPKFRSSAEQMTIQTNYREIERRIDKWETAEIGFFLTKCEVTQLVIDDISEAFQFFDSQNARGKDLEPHDLLKAYHLRELGFTRNRRAEDKNTSLVEAWENIPTKELANLFSEFLYRVRGWASGNSARYFSKADISMFKGINLSTDTEYPYTNLYRIVADHSEGLAASPIKAEFPFQLDQPILNGSHFFRMISYYHSMRDRLKSILGALAGRSALITKTIDTYEGKNRIGDKYARMLFDCAILQYMDKFGETDLADAVEKVFIWAYTPRLEYEVLQLASVDNYVVTKLNFFKVVRSATHREEVLRTELRPVSPRFNSEKTKAIKELFIQLKYYDRA